MKTQFLIIATFLATAFTQYIVEDAPVEPNPYIVEPVPAPVVKHPKNHVKTTVKPKKQPIAAPVEPNPYIVEPVPAPFVKHPKKPIKSIPQAKKQQFKKFSQHKSEQKKGLTFAEIQKINQELNVICNRLDQEEIKADQLLTAFKQSHGSDKVLLQLIQRIKSDAKEYRILFAELPKGSRQMRSWIGIDRLLKEVEGLGTKPAEKPLAKKVPELKPLPKRVPLPKKISEKKPLAKKAPATTPTGGYIVQ